MVTGFKRYLSLPVTRAPKRRPVAEEKADHVRSTSLPCPSHPLISHLEDEIAALRAWHSRTGPNRLGWVRFGLDLLERVLSSLTELLRLPQAQEWVRRSRGSVWTERLLEDSIRLADGFGTLRLEIMAMSDHQWTARTAIRRRDEPRFAGSARSMRRSKKDLVRVASALKSATRSPGTPRGSVTDAAEAELTGVVRQAIRALSALLASLHTPTPNATPPPGVVLILPLPRATSTASSPPRSTTPPPPFPNPKTPFRRSAACGPIAFSKDSLRLADVYGTFRIRDHCPERAPITRPSTAIRKGVTSRASRPAFRSLRRAEKDLIRPVVLSASSTSETPLDPPPPSIGSASNLAEAELIRIAEGCHVGVVASASESVLLGVTAGLCFRLNGGWRVVVEVERSMSAAPVANEDRDGGMRCGGEES
ncbi:hypothetical protein J5N97_029130 [Dioscorea zingiberensis]|uniref:Uncharacterized protein n=1 Tax=Dioscorea zingiberensis TaxID=325984 RepID=A0A9D5H5J8_9LILI|nr:hypothetical protein J5N97_029130 [Dioscorea zingiberensis]